MAQRIRSGFWNFSPLPSLDTPQLLLFSGKEAVCLAEWPAKMSQHTWPVASANLSTVISTKRPKAKGCKSPAHEAAVLEQIQGARWDKVQTLCMLHSHFVNPRPFPKSIKKHIKFRPKHS